MVNVTPSTWRVAFRVDAGTEIGTGHVMRCLTLAARLREQGAETHFICRVQGDYLDRLIEPQGHELHFLPQASDPQLVACNEPYASWLGVTIERDANDTKQLLSTIRPDLLVVDHYGIDARWETVVRSYVDKILVIDDLANRPHDCDVLLDQNVLRNADSRYTGLVSEHCQLLLGPRYALLRPEFGLARRHHPHLRLEVKRVLIFFGGSDQHDLTSLVLDSLEQLSDLDISVDVVVGAANLQSKSIEQRCRKNAKLNFFRQIDNMATLMSNADLAFGAAGGASWERCCLALPTILINFAENQIELACELARKRVLINLGLNTEMNAGSIERVLRKLIKRPSLMQRMSSRAGRLVDGRGAERIALILRRDASQLRPAQPDDVEQVWRWRNAPTTRQHFFDSSPVSLKDHRAWWLENICKSDRVLLIGSVGAINIGVLRFDVSGVKAVISIYIDPDLTGQGLGTSLTNKGLEWIKSSRPDILTVEAQVKPANEASRRMFISTGFKEEYTSLSWSREQSID